MTESGLEANPEPGSETPPSQPTKEPLAKSPERVFRWWWLIAGGMALLLLSFFLWRMNVSNRLEERIAAIRAAGEPITWEDLEAGYTLPEGNDVTEVLLQAFDQLTDEYDLALEADEDVNPNDSEGWDEDNQIEYPEIPFIYVPADGPISEPQWKAARKHLRLNEKPLEILMSLKQGDVARYPVDMSKGFMAILDHLGPLRESGNLLAVAALVAAKDKQSDRAARAIQNMFILSDTLKHEPTLVSYLVRLALLSMTAKATEAVMNRIDLSGPHMVDLDQVAQQAMGDSDLVQSFLWERASMVGLVYAIKKGELNEDGDMASFNNPFMDATGLIDLNCLAILDLMEGYIEAASEPLPERLHLIQDFGEGLFEGDGFHPTELLARILMPALGRVGDIDARARADLALMRAMIQVGQYRRNNQRLPERIESLKDPFDGKPIRIKKTDHGYLVYAIGEDLEDNGGKKKPRVEDDEPDPGDFGFDMVFQVDLTGRSKK